LSKLVIVESPAKAHTIQKFLGSSYKVVASMGHIRDLPKSKLGVDIKNGFEPEYINIRGKGDLIKELKKYAKDSQEIYLATDPDREGEAIAWHLAHVLDMDESKDCRVTFNEITKSTVKKSIASPRKIDKNLTDAQQARRVLDRIVGYQISPILWKKVKPGLSAGRVQSLAVKLIVDREEEIEKFIPEEYWNINVTLFDEKSGKTFEAKFYGRNDKKEELHTEKDVKEIVDALKNAKYIVKDVKLGEKKRTPAPPFTTSTLQQEASRKLGFTIKKTMSVAQGLYEGVKLPDLGSVGLITYMRTDSTRISEEARNEAKEVITKLYGEELYENRYYKTNKDAQDAHEGIRPSIVSINPDDIKSSLTPDQYKLYKLIYNRFLASQMKEAIYDTISVDIDANDILFKASGQNLKYKGFMSLYTESKDDEKEEEEEATLIPKLEVNQVLENKGLNPKQSFTEPPARFTEASLVKELEAKDIGRPSTYSPIISTIIDRRYIERKVKQLVPTELGKVVNKILVEYFGDIVNVEFTADIEKEFDEVAEGKIEWKKIIEKFYGPFEQELEKVTEELDKIQVVEEESEEICENCGRHMVVKIGRYGKFLACPGFPECKNIKPYVVNIDVPCPVCGGKVQVRKTRRGKNYYICENNKNTEDTCKYISWNKPQVGEEWVPDESVNEITTKKKTTKKKTTKKKSTKKSSKK
jgi:DNA topoisomerase-1